MCMDCEQPGMVRNGAEQVDGEWEPAAVMGAEWGQVSKMDRGWE